MTCWTLFGINGLINYIFILANCCLIVYLCDQIIRGEKMLCYHVV